MTSKDYDELCAKPTKAQTIKRAHAWLEAARARKINIDDDPDGYLAVIRGLMMEIERQDERLAYLEPIYTAAQALADEGREYDFADIGLGRGAPNSYWEDLDEALDPEPNDDAA